MSRPVQLAHRVLRAAGVDLVRYPGRTTPIGRRLRIMRSLGIDLVADVGANTGQYAAELRRLGYRGRIVSFEPQAAAYERLVKLAAADAGWDARHLALGSAPGTLELHLAGNSVSSSFLDMLPAHAAAAPASQYLGRESVQVETLDVLWADMAKGARRPFLKLDVQGYELEVLRGAAAVLPQMAMLQTELSLIPLYAGAPDVGTLLELLAGQGFLLASLEPGFEDPVSGRLLQMDGVFVRRDLVPGA